MDIKIKHDDYPYRVVYATNEFLLEKGFGRVAHLPFIFNNQPRYHRTANQFLIDIGLGIWSSNTRRLNNTSTTPPTESTMHDYASWLTNYLEYCHARGKDPLKAEYKIDLIQSYQGEMATGSWSRDNTPLSARTINLRIDIACMYLQWAESKGLRGHFHIPKQLKHISIHSRKSGGRKLNIPIEIRRGKVRESKRRLGFPEEKTIFNWMNRVREKCATEGLIAELILETAIRRAEAAAWRIDTLPMDRNKWHIVNPDKPLEHQAVCIKLRYNTKGHKYGKDHGDKIGPEGDILIPLTLALKLDIYRRIERPKALTILLRTAGNAHEAEEIRRNSVHLFLEPSTGKRYSGQKIYDFWTHKQVQCPRGWSPHLARDFWACSTLWKHLEEQNNLLETIINNRSEPSKLKKHALDIEGIIQLTIQRQLRHASSDTTMIYLQWVSDRLGVNLNFHENYLHVLDKNSSALESTS